MKRPDLTREETEVYLKTVKYGNMDDMFDLGYVIGRATYAKEQLDAINAHIANVEKEPNEETNASSSSKV